jgi:hypothetical protein
MEQQIIEQPKKLIEMVEVQSSNIKAVGYDSEAKELYVQYSSGTYKYLGVEPIIFEGLKLAESKGKYMNLVKKTYKYEKVN